MMRTNYRPHPAIRPFVPMKARILYLSVPVFAYPLVVTLCSLLLPRSAR